MSHDDLGMVLDSLGAVLGSPFFLRNLGLRRGAYTMRPNKIMAQINDFLTKVAANARRMGMEEIR